ncbi:PIG-L deacetylase family protein [Neolewinella agarilytica]|uniref:PIG-L deacetylase family protein n=1 Tax=Neolewinella agarilytica TaxID=478744 RepID=UPI0023560877|nr:PIG-L deacetylase family protein [Neolewinella agarilytica]
MLKYLLILCSVLLVGCGAETASVPEATSPGTIMAVFAHPDDETTVAPILSKYAAEGVTVHLVIATDGRYGVTDHAGIPAGDSLVEVRNGELACSCRALGIEPPIHLSRRDMLGMEQGMDAFFGQLIGMEDALEAVIDSLHPEVIITFGPDGDSGHPDHRLTADVTTELFFSGKLKYRPELYYFSYTPTQATKYGDWNLNYADEQFLNTRISFSETDAERYYDAIRCHQSQFTPQAMEDWIAAERADEDKRIFFRKVVVAEKEQVGF